MTYTAPRAAGPIPARQQQMEFPTVCPRCHAAAGDPCRTPRGRFAPAVHVGRVVSRTGV